MFGTVDEAVSVQLALLRDDTKQKELRYVPLSELSISELNPRGDRSKETVSRLAARIEKNGYEVTRAVWVYENGNGLEVFAGGTRLEAARLTSLTSIPAWIHAGYTEDDLVRLADEDNENDEYHEPVSLVDTWADYRRLYERGWTHERIAAAKGVARPRVTERLKFAGWPASVLGYVQKHDLNEGQLRELYNLYNHPPYLTEEAALLNVLQNVTTKTKTPTAKHFAAEVEARNALVDYCKQTAAELGTVTWYDGDSQYPWDAAGKFLSQIDWRLDDVRHAKRAAAEVRHMIAANAREHAERMQAEAQKARVIECRPGQWWQLGDHLLFVGDTAGDEFRQRATGAAFAFADPPYGAEVGDWDSAFYWEHDWLIDSAAIVAVTPGIVSIQKMMQLTAMPYVWSLAAWIDNGMTRSAVGFGNWIYIALFGRDSVHRNTQDHIRVSIKPDNDSAEHFKGRKPFDLIAHLVETFSKRGDIVIDPFLGSGTTLEACEYSGRRCIGGEKDPDRCRAIIENWQEKTGRVAEVIE